MPSQPRSTDGHWLCGDDLINWYVGEFGSQTILAFSGGKDSIAAALALRDRVDVVPVYRVMVPGLEFVERTLAYYERVLFGRSILRVAHPYGWNALVNQCDLDPAIASYVGSLSLKYISSSQGHGIDRQAAGCDLPIALGVRSADSATRYLSLAKTGPFTPSSRLWYPIWDMKRDDQIDTIEAAGIKLPIDYRIWGRSFDGLEYKYLRPLRDYFPDDYQRIISVFPLLEADFVRHEKSYH